MNNPIQPVYEVYQTYLTSARQNIQSYQKYLDLAAQLYKHNMHNQVMVYGQHPNATHVASKAVWNKIGRDINHGATAIATIAKRNSIPVIQLIYDISDTDGKDVTDILWADRFILNHEEQQYLLSALKEKHQLGSKDIYHTVLQIADKYISERYHNISNQDRSFVMKSIAYVISKKLQLDPSVIPVVSPLGIKDNKQFVALGSKVNLVSRKILDEFETEIEQIRSVKYVRVSEHQRNQNSSGEPARHEELSTWRDWEDNPEEYGGKSQLKILGFGDGRDTDRESVPKAGRTQGKGTQDTGTAGKRKSPSQHREHDGNREIPEQLTFDGTGNDNRGDLRANLTDKSNLESHSEQGGFSAVQTEIDETEIEKINYHVSTLNVEYGGAKTKYQNNIEAIKLLKTIESENRLATAEEQKVLAKYTGWGGIPEPFDIRYRDNPKWQTEFKELLEVLTPEEYREARATTLNAHYTALPIAALMFRAAEELGFGGGKVLEPSMGIGNFYSVFPSNLANKSELYGVEKDSISGRIVKQLYQQATIEVKGYEETSYPDNYFDLAIGNIPFGSFSVFDKRYQGENFKIHDYFIAKSLDKVKPNGLIAFITSKGTLDKANPSVRKYIAQRVELLGAVRLPNSAFQKIAHTEVTTDILFFRKYEQQKVNEPEWIHVGRTEQGVPVNEYYLRHPDHMLGTMVFDKSMYGNEKDTSCINDDPDFHLIGTLQQKLKEITEQQTPISTPPSVERDTKGITSQEENQIKEPLSEVEHPEVLPANPEVKNYTYTIVDNVLYYRENNEMFLQTFSGKTLERVKGMYAIREQVMWLIHLQTHDYADHAFQQELATLNQIYDTFVKDNGYLNDKVNRRAFQDDSDLPLLLSLENKKEDRYEKAAIFYKPTIQPTEEISAHSAKDALAISIYRRGKLDLAYMAEIYPHNVDEIITELDDQIFFDPAHLISSTMDNRSGYVTAEEYLSGNVKEKLKLAELKVEDYPELQKNITALQAVQPKRLNISEIHFEIGTSWIPLEYIREFCYETFHTPMYRREMDGDVSGRIYFHYDKHSTRYTIYNKPLGSSIETTSVYGTERKNAFYIVEDCLNLKQTEVTDRITVLNENGE